MCLAVISWNPEGATPLLLVANRDEFRARPTAPMRWWEQPRILAGQDLQAGGTWLGFGEDGRFGLLTNIRPGHIHRRGELSRGELIPDFLSISSSRSSSAPFSAAQSIERFHARVASEVDRYGGFNLVLGDRERLFWFSSDHPRGRWLEPGVYALSNDALDTPWPKTTLAAEQLRRHADRMAVDLLDHPVLQSTAQVPDEALPETGVSLEWERSLSAQTITDEVYGTRCRTHARRRAGGRVDVVEQQIGEDGAVVEEARFSYSL